MTRFTTPLSRAAHLLHSRSRSPRNVLGVTLALFATFGAITAVAALVPESTTASGSAETALASTATGTSTATATEASSTPTSAASATASSTADADSEDSGAGSEASATVQAVASAAAGASAAASGTAVDSHSNGHGCDDIIHAADRTPTPGGPVDCTVGKSGDHRQNGKTATASSAAADTAATSTASASATKADPHSNGHGCDDIIHAADRTPAPGGPVGCTVGNSGDHRQNGAHGAATATETAAASGIGSAGSTAASGGPGKSDHSGKKAK